MIVDCPSCNTQYNLEDSLIPASGRKVKCTVCEHVFGVKPEAPEAPEESLLEETSLEEPEAPAGVQRETYDLPDDLASMGDDDLDAMDDDGGISLGGDDGGLSLDLGEDNGKDKKKRKLKVSMPSFGGKKLAAIIGGGVFAVMLIGVAVIFFVNPSLIGLGPSEDVPLSPAEIQKQVENIALEGIRQYYVENEKAGRLFVVEGQAVNGFDIPKELIEVEANLYDDKDAVLATKRLKCGNKVSLFQLQMLSEKEIETALNDEAGIGSNNINIQPGAGVDFMIVFFNPPGTVTEFNIEVVSAKTVDL